jgi:hypothetical protein
VVAALAWVPSGSAQRFWREMAQAHLSPVVHSAFDVRPWLSQPGALPFSLKSHRGQSNQQLGFSLTGESAVSPLVSSRLGSDGPAYATVRMKLAGTVTAHGIGFAPSYSSGATAIERRPVFYQEDTPFSTQVRLPVVHLLGSRLRLDAFYREISTNNIVRGVAQSNDFWRPIAGGLSLRPAKSYGITVTFAFLNTTPGLIS